MTKISDKAARDELLAWANERFRPRSATAPSNTTRKNSLPTLDIARRARRASPFRQRLGSACQKPEFGQSMDSSLSDYASNMTLSGETLPQIMDLSKKVELLEKERDFYLNKLRHIENLCAKFGEMAKDERQAKVPIKKLAEVLYQTDEGFIEADELTYPKDEPQNLRKTSRIIDHEISFDESMDPSAASEIPNQRKISQPTLQNNSMRLSSSPTDEEKAAMFAARRFSIKENEGEEEVSAGILDSNAHQPGNIAMEEILSVTPIIEDNDPENVFE